jgi:YVTN family beta-propeller protein
MIAITIDGSAFSLAAGPDPPGGEGAMKLRISGLLAIMAFVACFLGSAQGLAENAYITNSGSNTVSVIDTTINAVTATIPLRVGGYPYGVAVSPDGSKVYVADLLPL